MNDAIVLLSVSQIVCLGGLAYLYMQVQGMGRGKSRKRRPGDAMRGQPLPQDIRVNERRQQQPGIVNRAQAQQPAPAMIPVPVATRMAELGVDVATMARRMNKSEEEVRLMLRRQAARS